MKNCDRGLENAARGRRPRAASSRPRRLFFAQKTVSIFVNTKTKSHESVTVARGQI